MMNLFLSEKSMMPLSMEGGASVRNVERVARRSVAR
jgi:hypothetical protein